MNSEKGNDVNDLCNVGRQKKIGELVVLLSGGIDSAVAAMLADKSGGQVIALTIGYGQRHSVEITYAEGLARKNGWEWIEIDLSGFGSALTGSALTDDEVPVPHGDYGEASMKATVVPMRNAVFMSMAMGVAASRGAYAVVTGAHASDAHTYPDCRPRFMHAMDGVARAALPEASTRPGFWHPLLMLSKAQVVKTGVSLGLDFADTWSCYEGAGLQCGECGTCRARIAAFTAAGVGDPTIYKTTMW